MLENINFF